MFNRPWLAIIAGVAQPRRDILENFAERLPASPELHEHVAMLREIVNGA
jgi:hypothetical protein